MSTPIRLFYSYARKDEKLRSELEIHLAALHREGLISGWHARSVDPGLDLHGQIHHGLEEAHMILLLLSADFLASDYCYEVEARRALARHEAGEAWVVPVLLRPVDWHSTPVARLEALPRNGRPVTRWRSRDQAWLDVARGIRRALEEVSAHRKAPVQLLVDDPDGVPFYLCSKLFGFTRPVRLALQQPCGVHLQRIVEGLALPARLEHAGRVGVTLDYELASQSQVLLRGRSLLEQGVRPGSNLELEVRVRHFAATDPVSGSEPAVVYRGPRSGPRAVEQRATLALLAELVPRGARRP